MRDSIPSMANNPAGRWPAVQLLGHLLLTAAVLVAAGAWLVSFDFSRPAPVPRAALQEGPTWSAVVREPSWAHGFETVYIVETEDEAANVLAQINELQMVQMILGVPISAAHVVLTDSPDDAQAVVDAIREGNRILAAFGAEDRVANLRTD